MPLLATNTRYGWNLLYTVVAGDFESFREAFRAGTKAYDVLKSSWLGGFFHRKTLNTLLTSLLYLRTETERMEHEVQDYEKRNIEIIESMDKVRDRNRRLVEQMERVGLSNAQINGNIVYTDTAWQSAIRNYAETLWKHSYMLGANPPMETIHALAKDNTANLISRLFSEEIGRLKAEQDKHSPGQVIV